MPPQVQSEQKTLVERVVANAARRNGVAALLPRGLQGLAGKKHPGWWGRPTDPASFSKHVEAARAWPATDPQTRADLTTLLGELDADPNVFEAKYGTAWFHYTLLKVVVRKLDEAGLFDDPRRMKLAQDLTRFGKTVASSSEETKRVLSGGGLVNRLRQLTGL